MVAQQYNRPCLTEPKCAKCRFWCACEFLLVFTVTVGDDSLHVCSSPISGLQ